VDCNTFLARNAVWDLILRESLEVYDETEVGADFVSHLIELLSQLGIELWELNGADEHPGTFKSCLADGLNRLILCVIEINLFDKARIVHLDVPLLQGAPVLLRDDLV